MRQIRFITRPNLLLQRLTTREPDEGMLEVAIAALNHVLAYEHSQETVADDLIFLEVATGRAEA